MKITKGQLRRIIKEEKRKLLREASDGNPKDVFYDVILPALESAGFSGLAAFKMARDAVDAGFADMRQMFGEGKITKSRSRKIIREAGQLNLPLGGGGPGGEYKYGEFASSPEVQNMLMDAGFNADGSADASGYPGPDGWQLYSPKDIPEAEAWIQAALDMNDALRKAATALDKGEYRTGQDAHYEIVSPVQDKHSNTGAADTEGREVSANWLEQQGYEWD
jgi:hypothetical protein